MSTLRISHVIIQPVLVWDSGEEFTPGPELNPVSLPPSKVADMLASLPAEVAALQLKLEAEQAAQAEAESHYAKHAANGTCPTCDDGTPSGDNGTVFCDMDS